MSSMASIVACLLLASVVIDAGGGQQRTAEEEEEESGDAVGGRGDEDPSSTSSRGLLEAYKKMFSAHRAYQLQAIEPLFTFGDYTKQYQLVDVMLKALFKVLTQARVNLTEWNYLPGDPFPRNETVKHALSKVLENTALFGDLVLMLPDIMHKLYDNNSGWKEEIKWGVWFCNNSGIFDAKHLQLLDLMSQEIELIPKRVDYVNPFKEAYKKSTKHQQFAADQKAKQKKQKKKAKKRGPKLSGTSHTEL